MYSIAVFMYATVVYKVYGVICEEALADPVIGQKIAY